MGQGHRRRPVAKRKGHSPGARPQKKGSGAAPAPLVYVRMLKSLFLGLFAFAGLCHAQMFEGRQLVNAQLIADADGVVPGQPVTIGLRLQTEPGWHTYWQ